MQNINMYCNNTSVDSCCSCSLHREVKGQGQPQLGTLLEGTSAEQVLIIACPDSSLAVCINDVVYNALRGINALINYLCPCLDRSNSPCMFHKRPGRGGERKIYLQIQLINEGREQVGPLWLYPPQQKTSEGWMEALGGRWEEENKRVNVTGTSG